MENLIEQLGISKEEIIERIVNKALGMTAGCKQTGEESWEDVPLSEVIDNKLESAIGNLIEKTKPFIEKRVEEIMIQKMNEVFDKPFQPVDRWGEPRGEKTTIKDLIANEAIEYWNKDVDCNNKPCGAYTSDKQTRAMFFAKKSIESFYKTEMESVVKKMAEDMKNKIPIAIGEEITKSVVKYLK